jgi:hypothetical protein
MMALIGSLMHFYKLVTQTSARLIAPGSLAIKYIKLLCGMKDAVDVHGVWLQCSSRSRLCAK